MDLFTGSKYQMRGIEAEVRAEERKFVEHEAKIFAEKLHKYE